mgnify:CR=1 FL=1
MCRAVVESITAMASCQRMNAPHSSEMPDCTEQEYDGYSSNWQKKDMQCRTFPALHTSGGSSSACSVSSALLLLATNTPAVLCPSNKLSSSCNRASLRAGSLSGSERIGCNTCSSRRRNKQDQGCEHHEKDS